MWTQQDVVQPLQLILRNMMRGSASLINVLKHQKPQSWIPSKTYAKYAIGPPQMFLSQSWASHWFLRHVLGVHLQCFFLLSGPLWLPCSPIGFSHWGSWHYNPSEIILARHMCLLLMVCGPCQLCTEWLLLPHHQVGGVSCYSSPFSPAILSIWWGMQL